MKKFKFRFILIALAVAFISATALPSLAAFAAQPDGVNPEEMLRNTLASLPEDIDTDTLSASGDKLYDVNLNEMGLEYRFSVDGREGFALLRAVKDEQDELFDYAVEEVYLDTQSPYSDSAKKIYAGQMAYIDYEGGEYRDSRTEEVIPDETMDAIRGLENTYKGSGSETNVVETIYYKYKTDNQFGFTYGLPPYKTTPFFDSCANIAGAVIIMYNDIHKTNLIPNFSPLVNGSYPSTQPQQYTDLIVTFNSLMNTKEGTGTTLNNFRNGLQSYINGRGYNVNYRSVMSGSSLNINAYKAEVMSARAVALCLQKYNAINYLLQGTGYDLISVNKSNTGHAMVGYGARDIDYFRDETVSIWSPVWYNPFRYITEVREVCFRSDTYLRVHTCLPMGMGYMRVDSSAKFDAAFGVEIY